MSSEGWPFDSALDESFSVELIVASGTHPASSRLTPYLVVVEDEEERDIYSTRRISRVKLAFRFSSAVVGCSIFFVAERRENVHKTNIFRSS